MNMPLKKLRTSVKKIPGMRRLYRGAKKFSLRATKPLLDHLLKLHGVTYNMWDVISTKNCEFMRDPEFMKGFQAANKQEYHLNYGGWVAYINQWASHHAKRLKGDFVECGVHKARFAMSNMIYINFKTLVDRRYYLFDTFCGLAKDFCSQEELSTYKGIYSEDTYEFVKNSFKDFSNVVIVRGPVPTTLAAVKIDQVAYLSIDMNCVLPELEALKYFWPKMVKAGIVILDDYAQIGHEKQKKALDDFATSEGVKILSLPTGQGMIIKS